MKSTTKLELYSILNALASYGKKTPQTKEVAVAYMKTIRKDLEDLKNKENKKLSYYSWLFGSNTLIQEIDRSIKEVDKNITALGAWVRSGAYYAGITALSYVGLIAGLYAFAFAAEALESKQPAVIKQTSALTFSIPDNDLQPIYITFEELRAREKLRAQEELRARLEAKALLKSQSESTHSTLSTAPADSDGNTASSERPIHSMPEANTLHWTNNHKPITFEEWQ